MTIRTVLALIFLTGVTACLEVQPSTIEACAKACAATGRSMLRVTPNECACSGGDMVDAGTEIAK
jgi:hypothetical protein